MPTPGSAHQMLPEKITGIGKQALKQELCFSLTIIKLTIPITTGHPVNPMMLVVRTTLIFTEQPTALGMTFLAQLGRFT